MSLGRAPQVLVVQRRMTHYRVPFFEALRHALRQHDCELTVAYGQGTAAESSKSDNAELSWGQGLSTHYALGGRLCWQPFGALLTQSDVVVMTAENKLLYNLWVQWRSRTRVMLWGHGGNLQGDPNSLRERFKRHVACQADGWLGYTALSQELIQASGFPPERITTLNNAIDTRELAQQVAAIDATREAFLRQALGLTAGPVALYLGSLYRDKRIDFLLQAAVRLRQQLPTFQLLVVGGGDLAPQVQQFCSQHPWAHSLGVLQGQAKAEALALADVMLSPGAVGLGILDSFAAGVPMVTTAASGHGPEIAYLEHRANGLMTSDTLDDYVSAVSSLLQGEAAEPSMRRLRQGCAAASSRYTLKNMAESFAAGVHRCLQTAPLRRAVAVGKSGGTKMTLRG